MKRRYFIFLVIVAFVTLLYVPIVLASPILGSAQSFAVLGHESVTNGHQGDNLTTQIYGNLGVTPGTSVTGFYPDGTVSGGTIHIEPDAVAQNALADATTAYNTLSSLSGTDLTGQNLGGGRTITPGVYTMTDSVAYLNGTLTLDAQGLSNALFVFNLAGALTTGNTQTAVVNVTGGDPSTGVYWVIGSTATLGDDAVFAGNILAHTTVILDPRAAILCGRAFALTGSVTLIDNLISNNNTLEDFDTGRSDFGSYGYSGGSYGYSGGSAAPVPIPAAAWLVGSGLIGLIGLRRKFRK